MLRMSRQEWERVEGVVDLALELPADERVSFIARTCGTDDLLRREAQAVLDRLQAMRAKA